MTPPLVLKLPMKKDMLQGSGLAKVVSVIQRYDHLFTGKELRFSQSHRTKRYGGGWTGLNWYMNELPHLRLITFLQSSHYLVDERILIDGQKQNNNGHTLGINIFGISCVAGTRGFCEMRFMSNETGQ